MTVYLDIIFLENILMNYIILTATGIVTKSGGKLIKTRMLLSSIIGSIYATIMYLKLFKFYQNFFAKIILSIIMVSLALIPKSTKEFIKKIVLFYLISFVFGGATIFFMYAVSPKNIQFKNGVFVGSYTAKIMLIAGVIAFLISVYAFKINKAKMTTKDMFCNIEIICRNKKVKARALVDSGNLLVDPLTKTPVIIVDEKIIDKIVPIKILKEKLGGDDEYKKRIRMIPFMSVGNKNGMLAGIRVDKINVFYNDEKIEVKNVIVGIYESSLSKDNKYNALIGLNLLEKKEKKYEFITDF